MKRKLFISCFLLLISALGQAQTREESWGRTVFGMKAGWIQSDVYGRDLDPWAVDGKTDKQHNFFMGISVFNTIGKHFGFKHELFYQQYGARFNRIGDDKTVWNADLRMRGLKLNPFSPTLKIGGLEIYTGPYLQILLNSSITALDEDGNRYRDSEIFGKGSEDTEAYKYLQKMDYGFVAGADYVFKEKLSIGVYYSKGFAPLFDNANSYGLESTPGMETLKIYNEAFGVSVGFYF